MSKNEPWFEFRRAQSTPVIMPLMPGASSFLPRLPAQGQTRDIKKNLPCGRIFYGALGGIRTHNLLIRSQMLYPIELRAHLFHFTKALIQPFVFFCKQNLNKFNFFLLNIRADMKILICF